LNTIRFIKNAISGFLLCVFAIGITPKQRMHDILTNHQHIRDDKQGVSVSKDRFNCDDENFVAESPFVDQNIIIELRLPVAFAINTNLFLTSYYFFHQFFFDLRGPPTVA